jgi:hypothetical protein
VWPLKCLPFSRSRLATWSTRIISNTTNHTSIRVHFPQSFCCNLGAPHGRLLCLAPRRVSDSAIPSDCQTRGIPVGRIPHRHDPPTQADKQSLSALRLLEARALARVVVAPRSEVGCAPCHRRSPPSTVTQSTTVSCLHLR